MSAGGDSGSVVCEGGEGVCADTDCGCASSSAAARILGLDFGIDKAIEKEFRERYLSRTLVGRYAVDVYFRNEDQVIQRSQEAARQEKSQEDVEFARYLYDTYAADVRNAMLQPDRSDLRLTSEHMSDAKQALARGKKHMSKEEKRAADELFKLAQEAVGKNVREILDMLNDEKMHERVVRIVESVPSLRGAKDC